MKKNKKRIGIIAMTLLLILAIGATAGTTLAKYISSASKTAQATVAKWGYTITTNTNELFSKYYDAEKIVEASDDTLDVSAATEVVAPGTSGVEKDKDNEGAMTFTINGEAEVDAQLIIDVTAFNTVWLQYEEDGEDGEKEKAVYFPLKWTIIAQNNEAKEEKVEIDFDEVKANDNFANVLAKQMAAALAKANLPDSAEVNDAASTGSKVVIDLPVGTTFKNFTLAITWEWPFTQEKSEEEGTNYDVEDTILGWLSDKTRGKNTFKDETLTSFDGQNEVEVELSDYGEGSYNLEVKIGFTVQIVQTNKANP